MYTIATAGHIDHGKSSLVKALTGTDPDRLPEEKAREMTIELGFASFRLSSGEEVGIIDVPGHERFIKTMIAGVGALDMVMFVIAADDGWMPQSEEHLAILRYLGVERGIIVLTKVDMVEPDWKEMVKSDLRVKVEGTFLEGCEIIEFSAVDNRNLETIRATVERMLKSTPRPLAGNSARLYVDRVFTIAGTGTVVTGTLREGMLAVGQELIHHPSGEKTRIKNLESFYSHLDKALPGIRLAVGLQSFDRATVQRGDLLSSSRQLQASTALGIMLHLEPKQARLVRHNRSIIFLHGTSEVEGKIMLPPTMVARDDGAIVAVLKLSSPVMVKTCDRFILRLPTPSVLVGGGMVIDPVLELFKRGATERWDLLKQAASLKTRDLVAYELTVKQIVAESELLQQSLLPGSEIRANIDHLVEHKEVIRRDRFLILKSVWDQAMELVLKQVTDYHQKNQHLASMPLAILTSQTELPPQLFDFVFDSLISANKLERYEAGVRRKDYAAGLTTAQEETRKRILSTLGANQRLAVNRDELLGNDKDAKKIYTYLKQKNDIVDIGGMVYLRETYDRFVAEIVGYIKSRGKMTVAEARDVTQTSRKVILPLLEELDRQKITKRDGDYRVLSQ
jgi:selenocysteine-specific elongation factor